MITFKAFVENQSDIAKVTVRGAVAVAAIAALMVTSIGDAEARRGTRVLQGIGIGVGAAIILNEALKAGEESERRGRARAAPSAPRVSLDGERIRALQTALVAHGYDAGSADGVWGNRARTATVQFQRDLGQPETGTLSGEQILLLRDATAGRIPQRVTTRLDQAAAIADEGGVRADSSHEDIRDMQSVLTQMGFYSGSIDGNWGRGVEAAVTRFQQHERSAPLGRLTLDQSERVLGRPLARAEPPAAPATVGSYEGRASDPQPPVRVMSVRPADQAPAARDDGAGLRFQDLPREVRTYVSKARNNCKEVTGRSLPAEGMQGIQQISLDGSPAVLVNNFDVCNPVSTGAVCSNRGCDLVIWKFDNSGAWNQVFEEHLHQLDLNLDPETKQIRSLKVRLTASDNRCNPVPGQHYTSGQSCGLDVKYSNGRWDFVVEQPIE